VRWSAFYFFIAKADKENGVISLTITLSNVLDVMEKLAPAHLAMEADPIGLQTPCDPTITKVLLALEANSRVVNEAKRRGANLIICHHPVIYRKLEKITGDTFAEHVIIAAIKKEVGIFVAHTNLDCAPEGVNDVLAQALELQNVRMLKRSFEERHHKVVVFVPGSHVDEVRAAMCKAGAGVIGDYSYCSFQTPGTGTFIPSEEAQPFSGQVGELNREAEFRLEVLVREGALYDVLAAMRNAHPYEEVAHDVYTLANPGFKYGMGRIGELPDAVGFKDYVELVKRRLGTKKVKIVGRPRKKIKRVAVCGGGGSGVFPDVMAAEVDAFVTGEIGYHQMVSADTMGLCVVEAGHGATERIVLPVLAENLQRRLPDLRILFSRIKTDRSEWV
jgi:dinuclear metal center YbgI/SA1388 family protein